jgi:hypothetical protein
VVVVVTVDVRTREELGRFEQVSRRAGHITIPETNLMNLAAPLHANVLHRTAVQKRAIDLIVEREDKLGVYILFGKRFG